MTTAGPNSPSTIVDAAGVGSRTWSNPGSAASQNDTYASVSGGSSAGPFTSRWLKCTGFGFSIPGGSTIDGIKVEVDRYKVEDFGTTSDSALRLVRAGTIESVNHSSPGDWQDGSDTNTYDVIGGPTDKWGASWSSSDINDSGFGFAMSVTLGKQDNAYVDHVRMTVYYTASSGISTTVSSIGLAATPRTPTAAKSTATTATSLTLTPRTPTAGKSHQPTSASLTITAHDAVVSIDHTVPVTAIPLYINAHAPLHITTAHYAGLVANWEGGSSWISPENAEGEPDNLFTSADLVTILGNTATGGLIATQFDYTEDDIAMLPGGIIDPDQIIKSIKFSLLAKADSYPNSLVGSAMITYGGSVIGTGKGSSGSWQTSPHEVSFGGTDDWGTGLTNDQLTNVEDGPTFGIVLSVAGDLGDTRHVEIDSIRANIAWEWYIDTGTVVPQLHITAHDALAGKIASTASQGLTLTPRTPSAAKSTATTAVSLTITAHDASAYRADDWRHVTAIPLTITPRAPDSAKFYHMATSYLAISQHDPATYFSSTPTAAELTISAHTPVVTPYHLPRIPLTVSAHDVVPSKSVTPVAGSLQITAHPPNVYKGVFTSTTGLQLAVSTHTAASPETARTTAIVLHLTPRSPHVNIPAARQSLTITPRTPVAKKKTTTTSKQLTITAHDAHVDMRSDADRIRLRITPRVPRSAKVVTVSSLSLSLAGHAPTRTSKRATAGHAALTLTPRTPVYSRTIHTSSIPLHITPRTPQSGKQFTVSATQLQLHTHVIYNRKSLSVSRIPLTITPRAPRKTSLARVTAIGLRLTPRPPFTTKAATAGHASLHLSVGGSTGRSGSLGRDTDERRKWYRSAESVPTGVGREDELRERYRSSNADEVRVINPQR